MMRVVTKGLSKRTFIQFVTKIVIGDRFQLLQTLYHKYYDTIHIWVIEVG